MSATIDIHVAPSGSDTAPGTEKRPLRTPAAALTLLRKKRKAAGAAVGGRILLAAGTYPLARTVAIGRGDSGIAPTVLKNTVESDAGAPTVITAAPGARAVLSGGRRIEGFAPTVVNGVQAWVARIPAVKAGKWSFRQLWVNGRRAPRTRLPEEGLYRIEQPIEDPERLRIEKKGMGFAAAGGHKKFRFAEGDLTAFSRLSDVDFVALHFWVASRIPFKRIDTQGRIAEIAFRPTYRLTDDFGPTGAPYYVENVFEALRTPGQWYLDRGEGLLYYIPRPGETITTTEVVAPALATVLRIDGASHVRVENVTFSHTELYPDDEIRELSGQAVPFVPAAVEILGSTRCSLVRCSVEHVGGYGVAIEGGSMDCEVRSCRITDLGAGGIKVFHTVVESDDPGAARRGRGERWRSCRRIVVSDNEIADGCHYFRQAVGVLVGKCSGVLVVHNDIHGFDYTGVSVGWTWGYDESDGIGNIIEHNHIHDIGRGVLSDMGGIYHLGVAPGTRIRYNHIHDVVSRGYGGWGIYTDEGSTDVLVECNLVHDTSISGYHQHFGRRNLVCNNIFAFGGKMQVQLTRLEPAHHAISFERNIFYADIPVMWEPNRGAIPDNAALAACVGADRNLYWSTAAGEPQFGGEGFAAWQARGLDVHGTVADPRFRNAARRDFAVAAESPAIALGFVPFDVSGAGPRTPTGAD
jgi:hypothetical protein